MGKVESGGIKLMDYLFTDGSIGKTIGNKIPVAIAVAPASHFADGKWRFMSLKNMSKSSTNGTLEDETMTYGKYGSDDLPVKYGAGAAVINSNGEYNGCNWNSRLPAGRTSGCRSNFTYLKNGWYYNGSNSGNNAPPPFLSDGITKNDVYYTAGQCLCDIIGEENTAILKNKSEYYGAITCSSFAPGYKNGEWYLPAVGEFAYAFTQWKEVDDAIVAAITADATCAIRLNNTSKYMTSTETSKNASVNIHGTSARLYNDYKHNQPAVVRAFIKI